MLPRTMLKKNLGILVVVLVLASLDSMAWSQEQRPAASSSTAAGKVIEPEGATGEEIYLIRLQGAPLALYEGGEPGYEATSPRATGARKLDAASPASLAYRELLAERHEHFEASAEALLGRRLDVVYRYSAANHGIAARMTPEEAAAIAALPEVVVVMRDFERQLMTDVGPQWIGADHIWDGTATGGLPAAMGEGVIVGVIDTGINPSNPSYADPGPVDAYDHTNPWGPGTYVGVCDPGDPSFDPTFPCNDKLIGAWGYAAVNGGDPRDNNGHGSHTSGTAAGNNMVDALIDAPTLAVLRTISGVAPHANLVMYAACCSGSALSAAIDQVVIDGVDVVNYSIGATGCTASSTPWTQFDTLGFLAAREAGIFVATSAGNCGPEDETLGSPADSPWLLSTGSLTHNRAFTNAIVSMSGGATTPPANLFGKSLTDFHGPAAVVYAGDYSNGDPDPEQCLNPFPPGTWTLGEIVICDRGSIARVTKGANVLAGGAGGFVLANTESSGESINSDGHFLPAVHLGFAAGTVLKDWVASGSGHMGSILGTVTDESPSNGDHMAAGSSRGPNRAVPDIISPSVTAPGVDVLAAHGTGDAVVWDLLSGTSMASPHAAGAAALLVQLHPDWTPAEIQSALMLTSSNAVAAEAFVIATPFAMGSGRVDMTAAARAWMVMDETNANYLAADPALGGDPKTLNLPSMANSNCGLRCSWTRFLREIAVTESPLSDWSASITMPAGVEAVVTTERLAQETGGRGELVQLRVTVTAAGIPTGDWVFGEVVLSATPEGFGDPPDLHLPIAVVFTGVAEIFADGFESGDTLEW